MSSTVRYCAVFDTIIEDMPATLFPDRPWGPGNNPKTAVREGSMPFPVESEVLKVRGSVPLQPLAT